MIKREIMQFVLLVNVINRAVEVVMGLPAHFL